MRITYPLLFLLSGNLLFAQNYIRQGYVVLTNGDTLHGFVHDMEWNSNPISIDFQRSKDAPIQKFGTNDLLSFSTNRPVTYEVHRVKYDPDNQDTQNLPSTREPEWEEETLFLQVIVNASTSLYRFDNRNGRTHFFMRPNNERLEELLNRKYITEINRARQLRVFEGWKQQLLNYSSDCSSLSGKINSAKYLEPSLKKIIEGINRCRGEQIVVAARGEKKPSQWGVMAQPFLNYSEIIWARTGFSEVNFGLGATYEAFSRKRPERISFYNELKYKRVSQEGESIFPSSVHFEFHSVRLISTLRFSYPLNKTTWFWNIGPNLGYRFNTVVEFENGTPFPGDYKDDMEVGIALGIGSVLLNKKKLKGSVEIRYELEQAPFGSTSYVGAHALGVVLGIKF